MRNERRRPERKWIEGKRVQVRELLPNQRLKIDREKVSGLPDTFFGRSSRMAKKRRDKDLELNDQGDRRDRLESAGDPLGKLLQIYRVSLAGVLIMSGMLAVIGLVVLAASALMRQRYSLIFLLVGAFVLLIAAVLLCIDVFNVGRRLELRKRGVRFVESGIVAEFFWDQIADIEVKRTDST